MQAAGAGERFRVWPAVRYLMIMRTFWLLTLATGELGPAAGQLGWRLSPRSLTVTGSGTCIAAMPAIPGARYADCGSCRASPG